MILSCANVRIAGVTAAVPGNQESIASLCASLPKDVAFKVKRVAALAGLQVRHVAPANMTASKLAIEAGRSLLSRLGWEPAIIDALFFVTQTPDYLLPSTGYTVHHELGLSVDCVVTDLTASCSGMIQGLWAASAHLRASGGRKILVLAADTPSKTFAPQDWGNRVLFGDAAGAMALEYVPEQGGEMHFLLESFPDTRGALTLYRSGHKQRTDDPKGFFMDGAQIMDFSQEKVPVNISRLLTHLNLSARDIDTFFMHQPNGAILQGIAKKVGIPQEKMPISIGKYGNCSLASIPVVMSDSAPKLEQRPQSVLLCGFGGGLAVASMITKLHPSSFFPVITVC